MGDQDVESFSGSHADLESAAEHLITSPPRPQPLAFEALSLKPPAKTVPPTPGTALQQKLESKLEKSLGSRLDIQLDQKMGAFEANILKAMKSLREDFQKSLQKTSQAEVDQTSASASKPSPSNTHLDPSPPRHNPVESMEVDYDPALPPRLLPLPSGTRWDSLVMKTRYKNLIQISPRERFPYQFSRNWNTRRGKISPLSTISTLEKCQYSLKSTFKKVKSQIRKGADPEKAAKCEYEEACEYLDLWNKTILIQHRALTCLSKSLAHILQRELYSMGNTGLLRREAEMTLLQPHLGEMRCQELRNSSFWPPSLFKSQLVKAGEDFLLKKGTSKDSQGFGPYQNKPFRGPHKKRGSYRK